MRVLNILKIFVKKLRTLLTLLAGYQNQDFEPCFRMLIMSSTKPSVDYFEYV